MQAVACVPGSASRILPVVSQNPAIAQASYLISGVTRDSTGAALGNCTVHFFRAADDLAIAQTTSDANGVFSTYVPAGVQYYIIAYLPGSPDVAGTTVNTLTGAQV